MDVVNILLVEDSPGDARLILEAFKDSQFKTRINVAPDGVEAMNFLLKKGVYENVSMPDIILLDLNLPRKDGRELLNDIKNDSDLKRIPVLVLTTSDSESDILRSYELHANSYITKPADLDEFLAVVKSVEQFWFNVAKLPPPPDTGTTH